jgi:GNAT superfamily N-acetyltransferase
MVEPLTFRKGTADDSYAVFLVFEEALADLLPRVGIQPNGRYDDPEKLDRSWRSRRALYEYLASNHDQFWVAEQKGRIVGFARSIVHDDVRELTEFFVRPDLQSQGIGKTLFERAFPADGKRHSIIATTDLRALVRYLKAGVYPRETLMYFGKKPLAQDVRHVNLSAVPVKPSDQTLDKMDQIDSHVLTYRRRRDHRFLFQDREGFLFRRAGRVVGYGYVGAYSGPFALLDSGDYPAALALAETAAAGQGLDHFGLEVPMSNNRAIDHALQNGYRMDSFIAFLMTDRPFGQFDRYIVTSPPFIL